MKLRVIGPYGGELPGCFLTSFLLDEALLLDAGTVSQVLDSAEQAKIRHVLLSHSHLDHTQGLPHMAVNVFANDSDPVAIYGLRQTLDSVTRHVLNNELWPDFTKIKRPNGKAVFEMVDLAEGKEVRIGAYQVRPVRVNHPVPTCGYIITRDGKSLAYSGDTGSTEDFWEAASDAPNLRMLLVEVSFPNRLQKLAEITGHLTVQDMAREVKKIRRALNVPIVSFHIKPEYEKEIRKEMKDLGLSNLELPKTGKVYSL